MKTINPKNSLSQTSQGRETSRRAGANDPSLLRSNEPTIPTDNKIGSRNSGPLGSSGKAKIK